MRRLSNISIIFFCISEFHLGMLLYLQPIFTANIYNIWCKLNKNIFNNSETMWDKICFSYAILMFCRMFYGDVSKSTISNKLQLAALHEMLMTCLSICHYSCEQSEKSKIVEKSLNCPTSKMFILEDNVVKSVDISILLSCLDSTIFFCFAAGK